MKLISILLVIPYINISNINYQIQNELCIKTSFIYITIILIYLNILIKKISNKSLGFKQNIISLLNPFLMKIIAISILGETLFNKYQYPYINILKKIKHLDFIERMDGLLSFEYIICFFFLLSFCFLIITKKAN